MKKFLFFSFFCLVFIVFTNTVNAQPGSGCCFWLEQIDPAQIVDPSNPNAAYSLNSVLPPTAPNSNYGVAEYYYFRFQNCPAGDPKARLSINWEFFVNGQPFDIPLDATAANPKNLMNVEIEWFLPIINQFEFQGSGPLLSGVGLDAKTEFITIGGVKRAVRTDFPGQVDASSNGALFGYFNPYGVQGRWYNFMYADFLEWACANNYLRLKITRYSDADIKANFKVMQRTNGAEFQQIYRMDQQQNYMGGHGAENPVQIGDFWLGQDTHPDLSDATIIVCSGNTISLDSAGIMIHHTRYPVVPDEPDTLTVLIPVLSPAWLCEEWVDSLITYTLIWMPTPETPYGDSTTLCRPGTLTLTASVPYEESYYTFNWYNDAALTDLIYTGKEFTNYYSVPDTLYEFFVTATIDTCEGDAERYVVLVHPLLEITAEILPTDSILCYGDSAIITLSATGGAPAYTFYYNGSALTGNTIKLPIGTYEFVVIDDNNCKDTTEITVTEPPLLVISAFIAAEDSVKCFGEDATISITAVGGTKPYTFYYLGAAIGTGDTVTIDLPANALAYEFDVIDNNNCKDTTEITVTEPLLLEIGVFIAEDDSIKCYGGNATITITAKGGTPPYTFYYDGSEIVTAIADTATISLPANFPNLYEFVIMDANDCTDTADITVTEPPLLVISAFIAEGDSVKCFGETATISVTAEGGTPPYTFYYLGASVVSLGSADTVTIDLPANSPALYEFVVIDSKDCTDTTEITVTQPDLLVINVFIAEEDSVKCNSGDATITITAEGGTKPYTFYYLGTAIGTGDTVTIDLPAAVYEFDVMDFNGCTDTTEFEVTQPNVLAINAFIAEEDSVKCYGGDATITITATGGTPPYTFYYLGAEIGTGDTVTIDLPANYPLAYEFDVIDYNDCKDTTEITVTEPPLLEISVFIAESDSIKCYGGDAIITITAQGGTPPYTFYYDGSEIVTAIADTATISLPANFPNLYEFVIMDAKNCTDTADITVTEPELLVINVFIAAGDSVKCNGETATITITATGGTKPYEFSYEGVSMGIGDTVKIDLSANVTPYEFTVIDANSCTDTTEIAVTEPPLLVMSAFIAENDSVKCYGDNATITVTAIGGTKPYTFYYLGTEIGTGDTVTIDLPANYPLEYELVVFDKHNCTDTTYITVTQPDSLILTVAAGSVECYGDSTTITLTATAGTPPYTYFYEGAPMIGSPTTGSVTIKLPARDEAYEFLVQDANSCEDTAMIIITQLDSLILTAAITAPILCYGDSATITLTAIDGLAPYTYYYNGVPIGAATAGSITIKLPARAEAYEFLVQDAHSCEDTAMVTVTQPTQLVISAFIAENDSVKCNGGNATITITATGGTKPYTFEYLGSPIPVVGADTVKIQLPANFPALYELVVIDNFGCTDTTEITVTEPTLLSASISAVTLGSDTVCPGATTGELQVTAIGGTPDYRYIWKNASGDSITNTIVATGLGAGIYTVIAIDAHGCTDTVTYEIAVYDTVTVAITATKACSSSNVTGSVVSSANATVTLEAYDLLADTLLFTDGPWALIAGTPYPFSYPVTSFGGDIHFIYFVAHASVDGVPCDYASVESDTVNLTDIPLFYVYAEAGGDPKLNYKEVEAGKPVTHYFRVHDFCNTAANMHLSVDYQYYYQPSEFASRVPASPITNYLNTVGGASMRYVTPMGDCSSSILTVEYDNISDASYFPHESGWTWATGTYNFFKLVFIDNREIAVQLSGFVEPGIYTIDYELVTHLPWSGPNLFGNTWASIFCGGPGGPVIGGNDFYTGSYKRVVLGRRTMTIVVDPVDVVSIPEVVRAEPAITVYPNPATDNIKIKFENIKEGPAQVRIMNISGQVVLDQRINIDNTDVNVRLPELKPGIYFVNVISEKAMLTRKLVIQPK